MSSQPNHADERTTRCYACFADVALSAATELPIVFEKSKKTKTAHLCRKCGSRVRRGKRIVKIGMWMCLFALFGWVFLNMTGHGGNPQGAYGVGFLGFAIACIGGAIEKSVTDRAAESFSGV